MLGWGGLLLSCLLCTGCFSHMDAVTVALETRQVQSCITTIGFPWPFIFTKIVTVTGGADIHTCLELDRALGVW
jgi:hypothetical protein